MYPERLTWLPQAPHFSGPLGPCASPRTLEDAQRRQLLPKTLPGLAELGLFRSGPWEIIPLQDRLGWQWGDTEGWMPWWSDGETELEVTRTDLMCFFLDLTNKSFCLTKLRNGMKWCLVDDEFGCCTLKYLGILGILIESTTNGIPYYPTRIYQDSRIIMDDISVNGMTESFEDAGILARLWGWDFTQMGSHPSTEIARNPVGTYWE